MGTLWTSSVPSGPGPDRVPPERLLVFEVFLIYCYLCFRDFSFERLLVLTIIAVGI